MNGLIARLSALALMSVLAVGLPACGGGDDDPNAASGSAPASASNMPSAAAKAPVPEGEIDFLGFEGDDILEIMKPWMKEHGIKVNSTYVNSESELEAKILSGGAQGVDLVSFTSPATKALLESGVVQPLDPEKIPNLADIREFFADGGEGYTLNEDGEWVGIPIFFGRIGIAWDGSVKEDVRSWDDLQDPAFTGKVGIIDFPQVLAYQGSAALGIELDQMSEDDLAKLRRWMEPIAAQAKTFTTSFGDLISLLGSKEVAAVAPGFTFLANAAKEAGNPNAMTTPSLDEATPTIMEMYGIPKTADNADAAYAWINEALAPRPNAKIADMQGSASTAKSAEPYVSAETKKLPAWTVGPEEFFRGGHLVSNAPRRSDEFVTEKELFAMWSDVKANAKQ